MHAALVDLGQFRWHQGDALRHGQHFVFQTFGREGAVGEALGGGFLAGEGVSGQKHLHGGAHAQQPRMELVVGKGS
jgi:hypothetical protein